MLRTIAFFVPGKPAPGGSKRPVPGRGRLAGKTILVDDAKGNATWRREVGTVAKAAMLRDGGPMLEGPLELRLRFFLEQPAGNRDLAPMRRPDTTKLVRAVEDALTGIVYADDAQITLQHPGRVWRATRPAGVHVVVRELFTAAQRWRAAYGPRSRARRNPRGR